ncbi:hypothetical protein MMC30_003258 [Trapelia coarctata]|nr:hypothetical protein [Trapelia coarctata]
MAEALAAAGLASSIVQFITFSCQLVERLKEFQSSIQEVPKTFRDISVQLPLLVDTLGKTKAQADSRQVTWETASALKPVVEGCLEQIKSLEDILTKTIPGQESSAWDRRFKALSSLRHDKAVQRISSALQSYIQYLTYHEASHKASILAAPQELITEPDGLQQKTCFMVKYDQDPNFVGREDIINEIDRRFALRQRRVALTGIGGVGKSQIAIEYSYRYRKRHPEVPVFWVHATKTRFEEGYRNIARELALPGLIDPAVDTVQLVTRWLSDHLNGPWLLILDNVDDIEALQEGCNLTSAQLDQKQATASISSYIPPSESGLILITTRDRRVGERLAHRQQPILVQPFTDKDAKHLLRCKLPEPDDWVEADSLELLEFLDHLPLAITQATSFISENRITLTEYLGLLRAGNSDTRDILREDLPDPGRDIEIRNSIYRTWRLSFDQISRQNPRAAEILSIMAILDRQAIPDLLLRKDSEGKVIFIKAIGTLKAYSLITEEKQGSIFGMHRLVQFA